MKERLALVLFAIFVACATVPRVALPVCSRNPGVVCRSPFAAFAFEGVFAWEHENVCPEKTDLSFRSCYLRAGTLGGVRAYQYQQWETR